MAHNHPLSLLSRHLTTPLALLLLLVGQTAVFTHAAPTVPTAISANIVISQIYGGGGNSGATYTHDFIELFNLGSSSVDITGWSVQYTSASGTTWQTTPLSGTIDPGQYYLVEEAQGAGGTTPLPTPDASGGLALSATSGKIALVNNSTPLTGCPSADIVDLIGYGSTANCAEGSTAPTLSNTTAALRGSDGCNETDNNAADFASGAPNPRNSSSPSNVCTPPSDDAPIVTATTPGDGDSEVDVNSNITIAFSEAVTVSSSWFDISCSSSGSHSASESGGSTSYTLNPGSDFTPGESCTVTVIATAISDDDSTDPPDNMPADYSFSFTTAVSNTWIINEIHADPDPSLGDANGDGTVSTSQDEFVEIVNNSGSTADISGWTVSDAIGVKHTFPSGTIVADQCAVLLFSGGTPTGSFGGAVVQTAVSALSLNNGPETVTLHDGSAIRATVSYGSEGGDNQSLTRDPDLSGAFVKHSLASGSSGSLFSPGTQLDGTPFSGCSAPADAAPTVTATTPADGASSVAVDSTITVQFSESVQVTGSWFDISCDSSSHSMAVSGSGSSRTLTPSPIFAPGESCVVTILASGVSDSDSNDPPDTMAADYVFSFTTAVSAPTHILINEADSDTPGSDTAEFIELYDGGSGNTNLTGLVVVLFNGGTDTSYNAFDLDGYSTNGSGYFLLGNTAVSGVDLTLSNGALQNGPDAIALYVGNAADFPNGTAVTTTNLLDAIVYGSTPDPELIALLNGGQLQVDENGGSGGSANDSNQRCPNGSGGQRNTVSYGHGIPTPKAANVCTVADDAPTVTATSPTDGASDIAIDTNLTITFSESVVVTGSWFTMSCASSGNHNASVSGSGSSRTLNPSANFAEGESCTVTINKDLVSDSDANDPPDTMAADYSWSFTTAIQPATNVLINEVDSDTPGSDTAEFIELYDGGSGNTNLTGLVVVLFNGGTDTSYNTFDLDGYATNGNGYFVLGNTAVSGVDLVISNGALQNGPDAIALYVGSATDFANGTAVTTANLLDAIVYGSTPDPGLMVLLNSGQPQVDENGGGGGSANDSNQRCPNGSGGQRNTISYGHGSPTPKTANACLVPDDAPTITATNPADGASDVAVNSNLTITFSESVTVSGGWFTISCASSGNHNASVSGSGSSRTLNPSANFAEGESCTVTIHANNVSDSDSNDPPDTMAADYSWSFTTAIQPATNILINEVDSDTPGADTAEFIELYDGGSGNTNLTGLVLVLFDGTTDSSYRAIDLDGYATNGNGYFLLGNTTVSGVDFTLGNSTVQNGADAVALYVGNGADFPNGTAVTTTNLLDAIVYGTSDPNDSGLLALLNSGQPQVDENGGGNGANDSSQRCPNGSGGQRNTASYGLGAPTPKAANSCTVADAAPSVTATTPANGASNVAVDSPITVQFSESVQVTGNWFNISCDGGSHSLAVSGSGSSRTLTPSPIFAAGESCVITILASGVSDSDSNDPPDNMAADYVFSFTTAVSTTPTAWVINEIHADPDPIAGDANGDGTPSTTQDEFVEIVNNSGDVVDISGWTVADSVTVRHTFANGTLIPDQCAIVLFGGGTPTGSFGGAVVLTAGSLGLNNGGDTVTLADAGGTVVQTAVYGAEGGDNQSLTRDPDLSGVYAKHSLANGSGGSLFSPGTRINGDSFGDCTPPDLPPSVSSTVPAADATDVAVDAPITVTFSEPVTVAGNWFDMSCTGSGSHSASVSGGAQSYTLTVDTPLAYGESCTVTLFASQISDQDGTPDGMAADYSWSFGTTAVPFVCGAPATPIHTIQGSGLASPLVGQIHHVEGVVVGDFQDTATQLSGFYLQETTADSDPATSEGLFVYDSGFGLDVAVGDRVRVVGQVAEYVSSSSDSLTELGSVSQMMVCSTGETVAATAVSFPVANWEAYEGMLVTLPQSLSVTEHFQLGRYGQVVLAVNGRLPQPTHVALPGAAANAIASANAQRTIILDDGSTRQNPAEIVHPAPGLTAGHTLRGGDTVTNLVGILDQRLDGYRIQPVGAVNFTPANPRPTNPPDVGGTLKIASFNVLNYFTTLDTGAALCGPAGNLGCRGANSDSEFARQRAKIIHALLALDADIVGLMEIENNAGEAVADLVAGLNEAAGSDLYAYVDTGTIGGDAIKVALIYKPGRVTAVNDFAVLDDVAPFTINTRPPLAQTFAENSSGEQLTVVVNHFKSKGCSGASGDNADLGDGQGCWNADRLLAAQMVLGWLAADPTGSSDPDVLIIGDLNAYALEDPVRAFTDAGYANLMAQFNGDAAYSYAFNGAWGYLDHGLSSPSLAPFVTGATEWHINADEPLALDYNEEFKSPEQIVSLYSDDPFRASDHDPVLIGLNLTQAAEPVLALQKEVEVGETAVLPGSTVTYTLTLSNSHPVAIAEGVLLTDTLPSAVAFGQWVVRPTGANVVNGEVTWQGTIAGEGTVVLVFTAVVQPGVVGEVENTAVFAYPTQSGSASARFTIAEPVRHVLYLPLIRK